MKKAPFIAAVSLLATIVAQPAWAGPSSGIFQQTISDNTIRTVSPSVPTDDNHGCTLRWAIGEVGGTNAEIGTSISLRYSVNESVERLSAITFAIDNPDGTLTVQRTAGTASWDVVLQFFCA